MRDSKKKKKFVCTPLHLADGVGARLEQVVPVWRDPWASLSIAPAAQGAHSQPGSIAF